MMATSLHSDQNVVHSDTTGAAPETTVLSGGARTLGLLRRRVLIQELTELDQLLGNVDELSRLRKEIRELRKQLERQRRGAAP
jgi:hypothetical protein